MRTFHLFLCLVLAVAGCGDNDDSGRDPAECDSIAGQIKVVAERDEDLNNYQGYDRTENPCAEPIPVTSETDYGPACQQLKECLAEVE